MYPFRRILFPVDYSEPCKAIVPYVRDMKKRCLAELTLVHAYGAGALLYLHLPITCSNLEDEASKVEKKHLVEFACEMFPNEHVETISELGESGDIIHKIAQHQGTDLVMLPTYGHGTVRRFLLGSTAAKVLHDIDSAVWTGTGDALSGHTPQLPYKSILCAVDETDEAEAVLRVASALASAMGPG
jgi:nucleotide-binding universal stress UspA family protein